MPTNVPYPYYYTQPKEEFSIGERIRAQRNAIREQMNLPPLDPVNLAPIIENLVDLNGVELGDEDDIVTQNIKLQAILIAILQAYNGLPKLTGISDEYIKNLVQWIKDKRHEEKSFPRPSYPQISNGGFPIALDTEESIQEIKTFDPYQWQQEIIRKMKEESPQLLSMKLKAP